MDEKSCDLPVWPRLVRPTNLMSRMNGNKTHTHNVMKIVCLPYLPTVAVAVVSYCIIYCFLFQYLVPICCFAEARLFTWGWRCSLVLLRMFCCSFNVGAKCLIRWLVRLCTLDLCPDIKLLVYKVHSTKQINFHRDLLDWLDTTSYSPEFKSRGIIYTKYICSGGKRWGVGKQRWHPLVDGGVVWEF